MMMIGTAITTHGAIRHAVDRQCVLRGGVSPLWKAQSNAIAMSGTVTAEGLESSASAYATVPAR